MRHGRRSGYTRVLGRRARLLAAVGLAALAAIGAMAGTASAKKATTVWLCKPGLMNDPCTQPLTTTVVQTDGATSTEKAKPNKKAPIDCFYVYPDGQRTADRKREPGNRTAGDAGRDRPGLALLGGLQGVCADVSADHARGAQQRGPISPRRQHQGLRGRGRGVRRIPREVQQGPRLRPASGTRRARCCSSS